MDREAVYQNVRKSYRLVYEVQDSIVEMVEYIRARIRYEDYAGKQLFSSALAKRRNLDDAYDADRKIENGMWSWDYIPTFMYMYFFVLQPTKNANCHFSILQVMDDGFKDLPPNNSPPSTQNFNPPEKSESYLLFSFSIFKKRSERIWFDHSGIEPIDDEVIEIIRINEEIQNKGMYIKSTADNCFIVMKRSIESIGNKDEAAEALKSFANLVDEKTGYHLLIEDLQAQKPLHQQHQGKHEHASTIINCATHAQMTAVYASVRILDEAIEGLPLHLYQQGDLTSKYKAKEHYTYSLVRTQPNVKITSFVSRETMMTHLLLWSNAYV